jgi:hypothetical protein
MRQQRIWVLVLMLILWSGFIGWGLTQAQNAAAQNPLTQVGTVDVVPQNLQLPQEVYLKQCSSCHIAIPAAAFPSQTWEQLLLDQEHYGVTLPRLVNPELGLTWKYLQVYSRPQSEDEPIPFRFRQSKLFKILHPRVAFSEPVTVDTCVSCHPAAPQFNFRQLTPQWDDAP